MINNLKKILTSKRFITLYYNVGYISAVGMVDGLLENVSNIGLPGWGVIGLGLVLSMLSKALANYKQGNSMGFLE